MKQSKLLKNNLVIGIMLIMITIGLTSMKPVTAYDPSGTWDYEVETPQGNMNDILTISKDGDAYKSTLATAQFGTLELGNIVLKGNKMSADIDMQGAFVVFNFEFDGNSMKGTVGAPDGDMDITAKRRKKK